MYNRVRLDPLEIKELREQQAHWYVCVGGCVFSDHDYGCVHMYYEAIVTCVQCALECIH